jgi:hypothetical protein
LGAESAERGRFSAISRFERRIDLPFRKGPRLSFLTVLLMARVICGNSLSEQVFRGERPAPGEIKRGGCRQDVKLGRTFRGWGFRDGLAKFRSPSGAS